MISDDGKDAVFQIQRVVRGVCEFTAFAQYDDLLGG